MVATNESTNEDKKFNWRLLTTTMGDLHGYSNDRNANFNKSNIYCSCLISIIIPYRFENSL